jgi:hypothetical protein
MKEEDPLKALKDIRQMMHQSVRFLSLSGLSGVFAGVYALIAAYLAYQKTNRTFNLEYQREDQAYLVFLGLATVVLAVITAYFLTRQKAKKLGLKTWDESAKAGLINLSIPLVSGGVFCMALIHGDMAVLIVPVMLTFYGLALINASRHTFPMLKQLGILEITLGLISSFFLGYGLLFWSVGFGLLHIIYGSYMYFKFDRA